MSLLTVALALSFAASATSLQVASSSTSIATAEYVLDSSIDVCEEAGQKQIKNKVLSLLEKPTGLPENPKWPKDPVEDEGGPVYEALSKMDEDTRYKTIGLLKAFHPVFFLDTYAKEVRDNALCNFKRMECMSIDDISTPLESLKGVRAWWALYDAMPDASKQQTNYVLTEMRKQVIEPSLMAYYRTAVEPSKKMVESTVPAGYPFDPIPSMPSSIEGDWDVTGKYPSVGTASLPTPDGPGYRQTKKAAWNSHRVSLLQTAEKSRQKCNDMSTETKKILCHLDFGVVLTKIARAMKKSGELPELTKSQEDAVLAQLDKLDAKVAQMKQTHRTACMQAKDI